MMNLGIGVLPPRGRVRLRAPPDPPEIQAQSREAGKGVFASGIGGSMLG